MSAPRPSDDVRSNPAAADAKLSRRDMARLLGAGAFALAFGNAFSFAQDSATPAAAAPQAGAGQGDGFYRVKAGDKLELTIVSDGGFALQPGMLFPQAPKDDLEAIAKANFFTTGYFPGTVNALLVRDGTSTILVDTGAGPNMGPKAGRLIGNLARAGVQPGDVTHVLITHAHPDHVGGLVDAGGKPQFPKARVVIGDVEHKFWTSDDAAQKLAGMGTLLPPEATKGMAAAAKGALTAVANQIQTVKGGDKVGDAITIVEAFGHTPGHVMLDIGSGDDAFRYIADLLHVLPVQLAHPDWMLFFDADPKAAAEQRKKHIAEMVASRVRVGGAHLPFPSVGHLGTGEGGAAARWVPAVWEW